MGTFEVTIEVGGPQSERFESLRALVDVDTGASDTVLPETVLRRLGINPIDRSRYRLADHRVIENDVGEARIRIDGSERTALVVFDPGGATALLGATTLELFHLAVDPVDQRLISVPGLLMRSGGSE